jgi:putative NADPH-quinone reductase
MKHVAIILGHPLGAETSFCSALARSYEEGAKEAGHDVSLIDTGQFDIPFLTQNSDHKTVGLSPELLNAQKKLKSAQHWVIIYPLWMGDMPAKLKAFLEWVLEPGFAFQYQSNKPPQKLLKGKSAHIIVTMGMPSCFYKLFYRAHSLKSFERNILKFCGISPVRKTLYGSVEIVSSEKRGDWYEIWSF